jgi:hypothetical protein
LQDLKAGTVIAVDFVIAPDGKPAGIKVKGKVPAGVVKAVSDYLATCPFAAARGPSGPVEWPMSMNFTFRPEGK